MKNVKKIISLAVCAAILCTAVAMLGSCNKSSTYNIGICQLISHPALDLATEGFKAALIKELGEDKVSFDYQEAAGEATACTTIVNNFVAKNYDLIMANATAALQAAAGATTTIPILGTSITEYGVALSINDFNGKTGINVSGTSDLAPLTEQANMIVTLFPQAQNIGLFYCSAEANSKYQVDVVKKTLEEKGKTASLFAFSDSNDIQSVLNAACAASDVIYIPTDNTAASSTEIINNISRETKTPIFAGEESICKGCGTFTLSISYYEIGYKTGLMAAEILRDGKDVKDMEIAYDPNPVKKYNKENCEFFGVSVPEGFEEIK